ncbi:MAG TPA: TonB family protein [Longimicrobium sp.]|nr:TonB family protein [Longimicrobium sp.]
MKLRIFALALTAALGALAPLRAQAPAAATDSAAEEALHDRARLRIRAALREAMVAQGIAEPDALLLLTRLSPGTPVQVRLLEGTAPPAALAAVDSVIQNALAPWPDRYVNEWIRPDEPLDTSNTIVEEAPELRNRGSLGGALDRFVRMHPGLGMPGQVISVEVRAIASRNGTVPYVEVSRSSGIVEVDQQLMNIMRRMRVRPARLGNNLVDVWITVPVTVQFPFEPPPQSRDQGGPP